jgi:hypothetical protein
MDIYYKLGASLARRARAADDPESAMLLDEAERHHRSAVAIGASLVDGFPDVTSYTVWYAISRCFLAGVLSRQGNYDEAQSLLDSTIADLRAKLKADPSLRALRGSLIHCYITQFFVLWEMGEIDLASSAMEKAQELRGRPSWIGPGRGRTPFGRRMSGRGGPNHRRGDEPAKDDAPPERKPAASDQSPSDDRR